MIGKLVWKNLWFKKGNLLLSALLFMLGTSVISLLLLVQHGISAKLDRDLQDIDAVVGAKGSPLQLVLSAVYHIDAPTGNIDYDDLKKATRGPLIEQVIPLAYGDGYRGYRILGTTQEYIDKYNGVLATGGFFSEPMQVVLGATMAANTGLKTGDSFLGNHGNEGEDHALPYTVSGVLKPSGTVLDFLAITQVESVWMVHDHEHEAESPKAAYAADTADHEGGDITAALIKYRSPMAIMTFPRMINAQTNFQAVNPTLEIKKLQNLMSVGADTLRAIALVIMLVSAISVWIMLYSRLKERRYELALIRTMGGSRWLLAGLLLLEGILLSLAGVLLGLLISRAILWVISSADSINRQIPFSFGLLPEEMILVGVTLLLGIAAALVPAMAAFRLNIAKTLSDG